MIPRSRVLVVISDLHVGSKVAIMPRGFVDDSQTPVGLNPLQEWFHQCWDDASTWLSDTLNGDEFGLVINGDVIEGNHHRTLEIWSPDAANHAAAAIQLLRPLARKAQKVWMVRGTECHVGNLEEYVAKEIGAVKNDAAKTFYWDRLALDCCGVRVAAKHHFPCTSRAYLEAGAHSIMMANAQIEAMRAGDTPPRIALSAHRHRTGAWSDGYSLSIVTGAWQALTRHGFKVVPDGRPCPSVYVMDWRNRDDGQLPEVHSRQYSPPPAKAETL